MIVIQVLAGVQSSVAYIYVYIVYVCKWVLEKAHACGQCVCSRYMCCDQYLPATLSTSSYSCPGVPSSSSGFLNSSFVSFLLLLFFSDLDLQQIVLQYNTLWLARCMCGNMQTHFKTRKVLLLTSKNYFNALYLTVTATLTFNGSGNRNYW